MDMATVAALEPELILAVLAGVDPRTVKLFGQTCRDFRAAAAFYESTGGYAASLVRFVTAGFASALAGAHRRCAPGGDAGGYAQHIAAVLAGRPPGAPPAWEKAECLRLLYPVALGLPDWPCAPYALEWCARHEHEAFGGVVAGPRRELLALLSADALGRLAALLTGGDSVDSITHKKILRLVLAAAFDRGGQRVPFVAAAAATVACVGAAASVQDRLTGLRVAACALRGCRLSEGDRHWLDLTGVNGDPKRSPKLMLSAFDCGGDSLYRLVLLMAEGSASNVPVPSPHLGAVLRACNA